MKLWHLYLTDKTKEKHLQEQVLLFCPLGLFKRLAEVNFACAEVWPAAIRWRGAARPPRCGSSRLRLSAGDGTLWSSRHVRTTNHMADGSGGRAGAVQGPKCAGFCRKQPKKAGRFRDFML